MATNTKENRFTGCTAAQMREAIDADPSCMVDVVLALAERILAKHPRRPTLDLFAELTGRPQYRKVMGGMNLPWHREWLADVQSIARLLVDAEARWRARQDKE